MQKHLAGLTRQNFLSEAVAGVTLLAVAVPPDIGPSAPPTEAAHIMRGTS